MLPTVYTSFKSPEQWLLKFEVKMGVALSLMESCVQGRKAKKTSFSFCGRTFHFPRSQRRRTDVCRAKRGQTVLLNGDQGKGKVLPRKEKRPRLYFPSPGTHNWHHRGTHFLSLWRLFNHKSNYIQTPLAWMLFMDGPHFIYRCPLLQSIAGCSGFF